MGIVHRVLKGLLMRKCLHPLQYYMAPSQFPSTSTPEQAHHKTRGERSILREVGATVALAFLLETLVLRGPFLSPLNECLATCTFAVSLGVRVCTLHAQNQFIRGM